MRIAYGDRAAFAVLYDRTAPMLLPRYRLRGRSEREALLALTEGFTRLWRKAPSYRSGSGAFAWIWHHSRA